MALLDARGSAHRQRHAVDHHDACAAPECTLLFDQLPHTFNTDDLNTLRRSGPIVRIGVKSQEAKTFTLFVQYDSEASATAVLSRGAILFIPSSFGTPTFSVAFTRVPGRQTHLYMTHVGHIIKNCGSSKRSDLDAIRAAVAPLIGRSGFIPVAVVPRIRNRS